MKKSPSLFPGVEKAIDDAFERHNPSDNAETALEDVVAEQLE
jgi:hypothetical protein